MAQRAIRFSESTDKTEIPARTHKTITSPGYYRPLNGLPVSQSAWTFYPIRLPVELRNGTCPFPRQVSSIGRIIEIPHLGGLHYLNRKVVRTVAKP